MSELSECIISDVPVAGPELPWLPLLLNSQEGRQVSNFLYLTLSLYDLDGPLPEVMAYDSSDQSRLLPTTRDPFT